MRGKVCTIDRRWNQVGGFHAVFFHGGICSKLPGGGEIVLWPGKELRRLAAQYTYLHLGKLALTPVK
jgi:hypothetical protein